jgi:hypothetical protein
MSVPEITLEYQNRSVFFFKTSEGSTCTASKDTYICGRGINNTQYLREISIKISSKTYNKLEKTFVRNGNYLTKHDAHENSCKYQLQCKTSSNKYLGQANGAMIIRNKKYAYIGFMVQHV